ncbi:hypothetical protein RhiirA1_476270 [Rhizophagus irregularis]|uniref:Uncharacterized protein n=1 Tax=Rhizophagus irregularis TaxID=588596 RepID=A0A2I1FD44_9GLOM|nr:hypothetical protein RhiirA1_476270 [Rhizophagus irregularis]PKY32268.1 hypothetical protein RhiirB3_450329 [Rhizophagus irregularis]
MEDSNAHIGLCPTHRRDIASLLLKFKNKLIELLKSEGNSSFSFDIDSRIINSNMFKLSPNILDSTLLSNLTPQLQIPHEQPWILLLHHLIPRDLAVFFDNYFSRACDRVKHLIQFISEFISELTTITWSPRSLSFKKWEKDLNITLKKKKNYWKNCSSSRQTSTIADNTSSITNRRRYGRYTRYYFNNMLPYFKRIVNIDESASIRWTTCNFLHSGTWESYRDTLLFNIDYFSPVRSFLDSLSPLRT